MKRTSILLIGILFAAMVVGVWIFWATISGEDWRKFGALSALFSGLAFVGLIFTVALQMNEIAKEDKNLRETLSRLDVQGAAQTYAAYLSFADRRIAYLLSAEADELAQEGINDEAERQKVLLQLKEGIRDKMISLEVLRDRIKRPEE